LRSTFDIPELTERFWQNAVRNPFYRPVKQPGATPFAFKAYEQVFAHLYECSTDKAGTKLLVDRILARLARTDTKKKA
jgi:hypothetical protein